MNRGGGRTAAWVWGAVALTAILFALVRVMPGLPVGDVDPLGAAIGLGIGLPSLYLTARALRPPAPTAAEAADQLAGAVTKRERTARQQLLGGHDQIIDLVFEFRPAPGHEAVGAGRQARLGKVVEYYHRLSPRRLVITGAPGAGKTVVAVELILGLLAARNPGQVVPVRISAASLNTELEPVGAVEQWLSDHLIRDYQLTKAAARALVEARLILPVIDGLDEMDSAERPGYDSRAARTLRAVNAYQDQHARAKGAVVLTCRTVQHQALEDLRVWAHDAARVEIAPVEAPLARLFLTARAANPARWEPVLKEIDRAPRVRWHVHCPRLGGLPWLPSSMTSATPPTPPEPLSGHLPSYLPWRLARTTYETTCWGCSFRLLLLSFHSLAMTVLTGCTAGWPPWPATSTTTPNLAAPWWEDGPCLAPT
ncbi:hypothetical protein ABZT47_40060 [Sphaerisporangium sp. NPDC005289]|uniref:NACHT domain-containing protein n=1 Tax=Sphaerisporangium sp. NPDC005289 TaxID=3155247 RepID=UPI0033B0F543